MTNQFPEDIFDRFVKGRLKEWLAAASPDKETPPFITALKTGGTKEEAIFALERMWEEMCELRADAARYRYLKEHSSYYYAEEYDPPSPREFGIEWQYQDCTPERPGMDLLLDREIEKVHLASRS